MFEYNSGKMFEFFNEYIFRYVLYLKCSRDFLWTCGDFKTTNNLFRVFIVIELDVLIMVSLKQPI